VDGPPATGEGCSIPVGSPGPPRYHSSTDPGAVVGVTEYSSQDRFAGGTMSDDPEYLNCLVSLDRVVP
jgi:hypothetical protein